MLGADVVPAIEELRVPAGLLSVDGRVRWLNDAAQTLFGDIRGRHYTDFVVPRDVRKVQEQWAKKVLGTPATDFSTELIARDGSIVPVDVSSVAVRNGSDRMVGVFGLWRPASRVAPVSAPTPSHLTPRQHEVLVHLAAGHSTANIADVLGISEDTVRNHVRGILRALKVNSRLQAVAVANAENLI